MCTSVQKQFLSEHMKKIALVAIAAVILTGCLPQGTPSKTQTLQSLKNDWKKIESLQYDIVVVKSPEGQEQTPPMKFYSKNRTKTRVEATVQGVESVFITNDETGASYIYYPEQKNYIDVSAIGQQSQKSQTELLDDLYADLEQGFEITGSEEVHGYDAYILEGTSEGVVQKVWIAKKLAVPIKIQTFDETGELVMDVEMQNISREKLSDELFSVPADAQAVSLIDMFGGLEGLEDFPLEDLE